MIALELLFNPGGEEATYKISRNAAVLLGKDGTDSEKIYCKIRKLYTKRSKLIHGVDSKESKHLIGAADVVELRGYVRESIKKIVKRDMNKTELMKILHSSGFGDYGEIKD